MLYRISKTKRTLTILFILFSLAGCARFTPNYEEPTVGLKTFRLIPTDGIVPTFEIGLHIINPNRDSLAVKGLFYTVAIGRYDQYNCSTFERSVATTDHLQDQNALLSADLRVHITFDPAYVFSRS